MNSNMKKVVIITGLTSSGKSKLALEIASKYNGEIISADSVQIYKGLDIGSAKESKENMSKISHYLIDIKNFNESYNVGEFVYDCNNALNEIFKKGKIPIIVGGTGLYIKALIEGYNLGGVSSNIDFRKKLEDLANKNGNQYIWQLLNNKNPEKAKTVHYNNTKRVIRYLEIEEFGQVENTTSILSDYDVCAVGIIDDRETIYKRINARVDEMLANNLEGEVRELINKGATREMQSMTSIGYKEWFDYFNGKITKQDTINLIKQHTRNYCKRQLTFLKTIKQLELLPIDEAKERIERFLC